MPEGFVGGVKCCVSDVQRSEKGFVRNWQLAGVIEAVENETNDHWNPDAARLGGNGAAG
jgi:hypothetical protein